MDPNLGNAADEYMTLRDQLDARKAAAHVMQKFGVTSLALSECLRDRGKLLSWAAARHTTAASEVHYLGAQTGRVSCAEPNLSQLSESGPDSREAFLAASEGDA